MTALPPEDSGANTSTLAQLTQPTLAQLQEACRACLMLAALTGKEKAVMIFGTLPDGWQGLAAEFPGICLGPQYGKERQWAITVDGVPTGIRPPVLMPPMPGQTVRVTEMSERDIALARMKQEEEAADRLMDTLPTIDGTPSKPKAQDLLEAGALPEGFAPIPILPPAKLTVPLDDKYLFGPATGR